MTILSYLLCVTLYTAPDSPKISPEFDVWLQSQPRNTAVKTWVFFTDKGIHEQSDYEEALRTAEQALTPRARIRRLKVRKAGNLCNFGDLPLHEEYVSKLRETGCRFGLASKWLNAATYTIEISKIPEVAKNPWIRKIQPVGIAHGVRDATRVLSSKEIDYGLSERQLKQINVTGAHEMGFTGKDVLIGLLDSGFEWRKNRTLPDIDVIAERDFIGCSSGRYDSCVSYDPEQIDTIICDGDTVFYSEQEEQIRHGTAMLTLLGARLPGQDGFVGSAFGACFALGKTEILYNPHTGGSEDIVVEEDWWIAGTEWLDSLGADIISSSLGYHDWWHGTDFEYDSLDGKHYRMSLVASSLYDKGILLVTAMGNRKTQLAVPESCMVAPADADSILAVGGVDTLGNWIYWDTQVPLGGIKGPRCDGEIKPEVCGPWIGTYRIPYPYPSYDSSMIMEGHGTSCATALVAGACALVMEAHPSWGPMKVRREVMKTASRASSPNNSLGHGIVDAAAAIAVPEIDRPGYDQDKLLSPYPSPFKPGKEGDEHLTLPYQLVSNTFARLSIYTLSGKIIWEQFTEEETLGQHYMTWDGRDTKGNLVASGIYVCLLRTGYYKDIRKFAVIR
jgi:hypothetical protein